MDSRLTRVAGDRPEAELDEVSRTNLAAQPQSGTSIFDPLLCELAYRWFCPPGGLILDPFAGGSVRGIVASMLGFRYMGVDLSGRQLAANRAQASAICSAPEPEWREGDSRDIGVVCSGASADFIFTCPPYHNLEVYSDDARDLSAMTYESFLAAYRAVIVATTALLKPDRFACFVVGDVRGPDGNYRGLPWATVDAFRAAGLPLYNEAVLITAVGSLPIRVARQWEAGRKLGKTHQNVFVFCKGDGKRAAGACGGD